MAQSRVFNIEGEASTQSLRHGSVMFVGTATTVITYGGFTILTDPNFLHAGNHAHVGFGVLTRRLTNPAIEIDQLPKLDLCLLSHMHEDHWDHIATDKLPKDLPIFTTKHAAFALKLSGFKNAKGMNKWQSMNVTKGGAWLKITAMPGRHGAGPMQLVLPQVMGSMLEWGTGSSAPAFRMYITGDTLAIDELKEIPKRFPNIDLALLHLGGTRVFGALVTMDAKQGIKAIRLVKPKRAIPIHYNDYTIFKSPLEDFVAEVQKVHLDTEITYLSHGESYEWNVPLLDATA